MFEAVHISGGTQIQITQGPNRSVVFICDTKMTLILILFYENNDLCDLWFLSLPLINSPDYDEYMVVSDSSQHLSCFNGNTDNPSSL